MCDSRLVKKQSNLSRIENLLYLLICMFAIISALTVILDFFYLRSISKFFQAFILLSCPILLSISDSSRSIGKNKKSIINFTIFVMIYLVALFIIDCFSTKINFSLRSRSFLQICFIYFWIYIAFSISSELLNKILYFIQKIFWVGVVFALIEFLIPEDIKILVLSLVYYGNIPDGYLSRDIDLGFFRLGSFYLNPLTFSFTLLFLFCYYTVFKNKTKGILLYIIAIIAQTKTAILGGILILFGKKAKLLNLIALFVTLSFVLFLCIFYDGWYFYYEFDDTTLKSLANHLSGLVFGVQEGFINIFGTGFGRSGFLVAMEAKEDPSMNMYFSVTPYENGNESTFGIIGYQLGGIFLIIHLWLFLKIYKFQLINKNYSIVSFTLLVILFQVFSESSLTLIISFCQAFLFAKATERAK